MAKQKATQGGGAGSDSIHTGEETRASWRVVVGWLDLIRDEDERWCIEYRFDDDSAHAAPIFEKLTLDRIANEGRLGVLEGICEQVVFLSDDDSTWIVMVFIGLQPSFARASDELAALIERVYEAEQLIGDRLVEVEPLVRSMSASRAAWAAPEGAESA